MTNSEWLSQMNDYGFKYDLLCNAQDRLEWGCSCIVEVLSGSSECPDQNLDETDYERCCRCIDQWLFKEHMQED